MGPVRIGLTACADLVRLGRVRWDMAGPGKADVVWDGAEGWGLVRSGSEGSGRRGP